MLIDVFDQEGRNKILGEFAECLENNKIDYPGDSFTMQITD